MSLIENVGVIIRQLFSGFHITDSLDPDTLGLDHRIAVRVARVVDEPRFVPIDGRIDDDIVIDCEKVGVMPVRFVVRVSGICLDRRKALAGVFDESRSFRYALRCESTESLNR